MTTLYDLLGALPGDDADDLRDAFRRAVKDVHPDIRPNDPDAALNFRLIVYAMEVLRDPEQRAAYDYLLDLARQELVSQHRAARIRTFAFAMIGLAGVSVAAASAYVLSTPISALPLHVRQMVNLSHGWADIALNGRSAPPLKDDGATAGGDADTAKPAQPQDDFLTRWGANDVDPKADREAATAKAAEPQTPSPPRSNPTDTPAPADRDAETAKAAEPADGPQRPSNPSDNTTTADRAAETATVMKEQPPPIVHPPGPELQARHDDADDAEFQIAPYDKTDASAVMQAKGIVAYRKGDLDAALADLSRAIELNPRFMLAYINRGIVLYRMGKLDRALADVARAKRIDRAGQGRPMAAVHGKRRHDRSAIEPAAMQAAGS